MESGGGVEGAVEARSSGDGESGGASHRSQRVLSIGLGLGCRWELAAAVNLVSHIGYWNTESS